MGNLLTYNSVQNDLKIRQYSFKLESKMLGILYLKHSGEINTHQYCDRDVATRQCRWWRHFRRRYICRLV